MKRFIAWVNRHWTHIRDTEKDFGIRALIHIPAGFFAGLFGGRDFIELIIFYEKNEDRHTQDQAWKDAFGIMVGYVIGRLVRWTAIIWFLIWLWSILKGVIL